MTSGTMATMNWDAISAISQLVGSLAVVLSVLYLAVQVHQSTRVAKSPCKTPRQRPCAM